MKVCPNCNAVWEDDVQFCANCGKAIPAAEAPAAEPVSQAAAPQGEAPRQQPPVYQPPINYYQRPAEEHISTGKWVLYHLIPMIPVVGSLIYLIMLFVWGFGDDKNETFRNWAKSQLILCLISVGLVVLTIIAVAILGVGFFSIAESGGVTNW